MRWIRTDWSFEERAAVLTLSVFSPLAARFKKTAAEIPEPDKIELLALALIAECRPDLQGGQLYGIELCMTAAEWRFFYLHPALPRRPYGAMGESIKLVPPDAQDREVRSHVVPRPVA